MGKLIIWRLKEQAGNDGGDDADGSAENNIAGIVLAEVDAGYADQNAENHQRQEKERVFDGDDTGQCHDSCGVGTGEGGVVLHQFVEDIDTA